MKGDKLFEIDALAFPHQQKSNTACLVAKALAIFAALVGGVCLAFGHNDSFAVG